MSDEKTYSEAEVRERERAAFVAGADAMYSDRGDRSMTRGLEHYSKVAERLYPTPTRPRVVIHNNVAYRFRGGWLEMEDGAGSWRPSQSYTAESVRVLAELIANPTEALP